MATVIKMSPRPGREAARVDFLVDENGERIDVPDDSGVQPTRDSERAIGATSPASWWRWSLVALGAVALVLLIMQVFSGTPGTNVQPGTPVAAPQEPAPQP